MDVQKLLRKRKPKGEDYARIVALRTLASYDTLLEFPQLQSLARDKGLELKVNQWAATATPEEYVGFTDFLTMFDWVRKVHNEAKTHTTRAAIAFNNLIQAMLGVNAAEKSFDYLDQINAPMEGEEAGSVESALNSLDISFYVEDSNLGREQLRNITITRAIMQESMYFVKAYNAIVEEIAARFDFEEIRIMQIVLTVGESNFNLFNEYKEEFKIYLLEHQRLKKVSALDFVFPDLFVEDSDLGKEQLQLLKKLARKKDSYKYSDIRNLCDREIPIQSEQELEDFILDYNS